MTQVVVTRGFWLRGELQAVDAVLDIDLPLAVELAGYGKVALLPPAPPPAAPDSPAAAPASEPPPRRARPRKEPTA